jgi:hypothetical protein
MFTIPKGTLASKSMSPATKLVLAFMNGTIPTNPQIAYEAIAQGTALTPSSAVKAVRYLIDNEFIFKDKNERGWCVYSLKGSAE